MSKNIILGISITSLIFVVILCATTSMTIKSMSKIIVQMKDNILKTLNVQYDEKINDKDNDLDCIYCNKKIKAGQIYIKFTAGHVSESYHNSCWKKTIRESDKMVREKKEGGF